jgi:hypothetical protein
MIAKSLVLATSMLALVTISGQALAGTRGPHKRHSLNEAQPLSAGVVRQPENAFALLTPPQTSGYIEHRYQGGPKSDIY